MLNPDELDNFELAEFASGVMATKVSHDFPNDELTRFVCANISYFIENPHDSFAFWNLQKYLWHASVRLESPESRNMAFKAYEQVFVSVVGGIKTTRSQSGDRPRELIRLAAANAMAKVLLPKDSPVR